jgi:hypothetical protein
MSLPISIHGCPYCGTRAVEYATEPVRAGRDLMASEALCINGHTYRLAWRSLESVEAVRRRVVAAQEIMEGIRDRWPAGTVEHEVAEAAARGIPRLRERGLLP